MKLDLERTDAGRSLLEIVGEVSLGLPNGGPDRTRVSGELTVDFVSQRFLLAGTLSAKGRADCGRCLEEFDCTWEVPVDIQVLLDSGSDEGAGDSLVIRQNHGEVDLRDPLRELLILSFPLAPVCGEDCRGLCPNCGINRNAGECACAEEDYDPRWEGLP